MHPNSINPINTYSKMKKLFVLFAVAGFVLTSCGSNAQKEESTVIEKAEETAQEVADSAAALVDSTVAAIDSTVVETVQE